MWFENLAREFRELGHSESATAERVLDQVSRSAAASVPGCSAALMVVWREVTGADGSARHVVADYGASHADLSTALERQYTSGQGPAVEAVRRARPVHVRDLLREQNRWPRYTSTAIQCGDRSSLTLPSPLPGGDRVLTFGMHSGRAEAFDEQTLTPLAALLAEHVAGALYTADRQTDAARETAHMRRAMSARTVIDQAKGIIMHARGCGPEEAFTSLREVAQRNRKKVVEVARDLVTENATVHRPPGG